MDRITITAPDDWHCHFRDATFLERTVRDCSARFARAIVMPNLKPPVLSVQDAESYRQRILNALPENISFSPLMTLYLSTETTEAMIREAAASPCVLGVKLYPSGVTTNSHAGINDIQDIYSLLAVMEECDLPLLLHGESNDPKADVFDREALFITEKLIPIIQHFPKLRVILEHISTRTAVEFVQEASERVAATITPHHLMLNRNHLLDDGIRPHYYCKPILKRQEDQTALIKAAISGNPKFFLGTDSAPHSIKNKEAACGCAGVYSAHAALELYTQVFEQNQALDKLENFASIYGPQFYKLPINTRSISLHKKSWQVPHSLSFGSEQLVPLCAGETIEWQIEGVNYP